MQLSSAFSLAGRASQVWAVALGTVSTLASYRFAYLFVHSGLTPIALLSPGYIGAMFLSDQPYVFLAVSGLINCVYYALVLRALKWFVQRRDNS